ncbi:hypothetical protein L484_024160 [Morus notabilis]|uniref:Uncharacterized protein n=1 Tax=Morus notabilis TaxID=981085 RepID=W9RV39_9ROSA|nr:hypothetical protein L484_024160 [Morus notabilis]
MADVSTEGVEISQLSCRPLEEVKSATYEERASALKAAEELQREDEDGKEYDAVYIGERSGLSGGRRSFRREHKSDDGDAHV